MASTITITQVSPSTALFRVQLDGMSTPHLVKSGAAGDDKDLTSLSPGPLKEYLTRLANWSVIPAGNRIRWRLIFSSTGTPQTPVVGPLTVGQNIIQAATTSISFVANVGAGEMVVEMSFVHSSAR